MNYHHLSFVIIGLLATNIAHADLPLTVEDLLADKNRFKLDTHISYYNQSKNSLATQGFDVVDLGSGRSLYIPTAASESRSNTDGIILGLGLRYGVGDRWELGVKGNGIYNTQRTQIDNELSHRDDAYLQDVSISTQYQTTKNHKSLPDSLVFSELSLYDNTAGLQNKGGASALIGGAVYTVNDPIVLSLTGTYQYQAKREFIQGGRVDLGDVAMLNASVGFAVNPDITLTGGVGVRHKWADKNDVKLENNTTQTTLNLGLAYAMSARTNLTANVRLPISGDSGSTISVGLSSKLGKLPPPLSQKYRQNQSVEPTLP